MTNNQFVFLLVLELSYYVVRGQSWNDYALTHFERWTSLYYADVIWLFGLYLIFFKCLMGEIQKRIKWTPAKITKEEKSEPNNIKGLLYDKKNNEDNFQRKSFAEQLANRILATNNPEGSVAVAVTGEWASGKSTFLSYIKEYLEGKAIVIEMNPGATESKRLLVKDFFDTIAEELQSYDAAVSELVYDYVDSLLEVHENGIIKVLKKVFAFNKTNSTKERFKTLSGCIKQLHQPLIIFIDDLDRLDKKETKEVLRLIRNTANFSNVIYIVAFDKKYVIDQIRTEEDKEGKYLDKLFQLEVSLPFYESNKITDYLFKVLEERFSEEKTEILKTQKYIGAFVKNHRDVNRLVNSFSVIYDCYKSEDESFEVDFCDLFLLEIIRVKRFEMYQELFELGGLDNYIAEYDEYNPDSFYSQDDNTMPEYWQMFWFWKLPYEKYNKVNRLGDIDNFKQYFKFGKLEGRLTRQQLLEVIYDTTKSKEESLEETKQFSTTDLNRFLHFAIVNIQPKNGKGISFVHFERTFHLLNYWYVQELVAFDLSVKNITIPVGSTTIPIENHLINIFDTVVRKEEYAQFRKDNGGKLGEILVTFVKKQIDESRNPEQYWSFIISLRELKHIKEDVFLSIATSYINFLSSRFPLTEKSWLQIEKIMANCEKVSFTSELESYALSDLSNMQFLIKQLFKSSDESSGSRLLRNTTIIEKIWGSEQRLEDSITHKMLPRATNDIKPTLLPLLLMLNDTNPITRSVLQEKYWTGLDFLEEYLPPVYE